MIATRSNMQSHKSITIDIFQDGCFGAQFLASAKNGRGAQSCELCNHPLRHQYLGANRTSRGA